MFMNSLSPSLLWKQKGLFLDNVDLTFEYPVYPKVVKVKNSLFF